MKDFTVVDTSGIHTITLRFCGCIGAPHPRIQLLASSWFPASLNHPQTAFTFDVLDTFQHLNVQGKISAYDFYYSLNHKTDNTSTLGIQVCARLFGSAMSLTWIAETGPIPPIPHRRSYISPHKNAQEGWSRAQSWRCQCNTARWLRRWVSGMPTSWAQFTWGLGRCARAHQVGYGPKYVVIHVLNPIGQMAVCSYHNHRCELPAKAKGEGYQGRPGPWRWLGPLGILEALS